MKKGLKRLALIVFSLVLIGIATYLVISNSLKKERVKVSKVTDPETLRAITYDQVQDSDYPVENTNGNLEFTAFFLRDLDEDGDGERILGTCKEINDTDTLYLDLNMFSEGSFINGEITISGNSFYNTMNMIKDSVLMENYIGKDIRTIKLKDISAGTQKLVISKIKSNIGSNINNYSGDGIIQVTLTGTYVDDNQHATDISKTINLDLDWYGKTSTSFYTNAKTYYTSEMSNTNMEFSFTVYEMADELILKENGSIITIPELNGFSPTNVICKNSGVSSTYDQETRVLTITKNSVVNQDGNLTKTLPSTNSYTVQLTYPQEAYDLVDSHTVLNIPITTYYDGYNNSNEEFDNPYRSTINRNASIILKKENTSGFIYNFFVSFEDDKYLGNIREYGVSKQFLLNMIDGNIDIENKEGVVLWRAVRGTQGDVSSITMKETKQTDNYGDSWDDIIMDEYVYNTGIYFNDPSPMLGNAGKISIYNDETNELIKEFTSADWNKYSRKNPYTYDENIKHIRVETTSANKDTSLEVFSIKELDVEKVIQDFSREEVENVRLIKTYLTGICDLGEGALATKRTSDVTNFVSEISDVDISLSKASASTQEESTQTIYVQTSGNYLNNAKWKDGEFLIKVPSQIINMEITNISVNKSDVEIVAYDLYKEDDNYFIKIITANEEPEFYRISIATKITCDPRISTQDGNFYLDAYNEFCSDYLNPKEDIYDVDGDNNKTENIGTDNIKMTFLSPTTLVTVETITDYDENQDDEITVSPNVAEIDNNVRSAKINLSLANNYNDVVKNIVIVGRIPFAGNTYIKSDRSLNSQFNTKMKNTGIHPASDNPEDINGNLEIYYSENPTATNDLTLDSNGWKKKEQVTDFNKIKSYLISLVDATLDAGSIAKFDYDITLPGNVSYNQESYSAHAVFFDVVTENGALTLSTEPGKVGVRVVRKFDFELTKIKEGKTLVVPGATYSLLEEYTLDGEDIQKTRIINTDSNGKILVGNMYANRNYTLKEVVAPDDYVLSNKTVKFNVSENSSGNLQINVTSGDKFVENPTVTTTADKTVFHAKLDDEPKYNITLTKMDQATGAKLEGVRFKLEDSGKIYTSDANGNITIERLVLNREYLLKEIKHDGYYLKEYRFKLNKNSNGTIEMVSSDLSNVNVVNDNNTSLIQVTSDITNEKIPTYKLELLKISAEDDNGTGLEGAKFKINYGDLNKNVTEVTDSNGIIVLDDLYQFVSGRNITGKYTLNELQAPDGYVLNTESIEFYVQKQNGELNVNITDRDNIKSLKDVVVNGDTVRFIIQDSPQFVLTKVDEVTNEPLANIKFKVYRTDSSFNEIKDFAKNGKGEYIGEQDENGEYYVVTDENGKIILPLIGGYYKAVEVEAPEKYDLSDEERSTVKIVIPGGAADYEIYYVEDWINIATEVASGESYEGKTVALMRDLDLADPESYIAPNDIFYYSIGNQNLNTGVPVIDYVNEHGLFPIGNQYSQAFSGVFLGNNHSINNHNSGISLFDYIQGARISDLTVNGNCVSSPTLPFNGTIVSQAYLSEIVNCNSNVNYNFVCYNSEYGNVLAGIIAMAVDCKIENCSNTGNMAISEITFVSGIVGGSFNSIITKCYNTGNIETNALYVSGIEAYSNDGVFYEENSIREISDCYNSGNIHTYNALYVGGISAYYNSSYGNQVSNMTNCYNTGIFTGYTQMGGGIAGYSCYGEISNCYNTGDSNTINSSTSSPSDLYIQSDNYSGYGSLGFGGILGAGEGVNISESYNEGDICYSSTDYNSSAAGIVSLLFHGKVKDCYNTGNIYSSYLAGILSIGQDIEIDSCYNEGNIISDVIPNDGYCWAGGIANGINGRVINCYNVGNMFIDGYDSSYDYSSGLVLWFNELSGAENGIYNSYNLGKADYAFYGYGYSSYNTTISENPIDLINIYNAGECKSLVAPSDRANENPNNIYYIDSFVRENDYDTRVDDGFGTGYTLMTEAQMKAQSFVNTLNNNRSTISDETATWKATNGYPELNIVETLDINPDLTPEPNPFNGITNVTVKNKEKEFKITTEVKTVNGTNGGYISGEGEKPYETVIYDHNSEKTIKMTPKYGFAITSITINGEEYSYQVASDDTFTLPQFTNMKEDKHIVVTYSPVSSILTIKKVDQDNNSKVLSGAKFKVVPEGSQNGEEIITNDYGEARISLGVGTYVVTEIEAPDGYRLNSTSQTVEVGPGLPNTLTFKNKVNPKLVVHHYLKNADGTTTTKKLAEDDIDSGEIGSEYTSAPHMDLEGVELEKDTNGDYVIPNNASGNYGTSDIEVIYYYTPNPKKLTIHHYIDGTETKIVEDTVQEIPSTVNYQGIGDYTVTVNETYKLDTNADYINILNDYIFTSVLTSVNETNEITDTIEYHDDAEITYYYTLKKHTITTELVSHEEERFDENTLQNTTIDVVGGTITGDFNDEYTEEDGIRYIEDVNQNADSTIRIVATPDNGYRVKSIRIKSTKDDDTSTEQIVYGTNAVSSPEVTATVDTNGVVTLTIFRSVVEDKHILAEFEPIEGKVVVHHYYEGTGEEFGNDPVSVVDVNGDEVENEEITGYVGDIYITKPYDDIGPMYTLSSKSTNTSGNYTEDIINVYYYYKYDEFNYKIEHYYEDKTSHEYIKDDAATDERKAEWDQTINVAITDRKVKNGYEYERQEGSPLTISYDESLNVIKLYYGLADYEYTVHYFYNFVEDTETEGLPESHSAEYLDVITSVTDRPKEYVFEKIVYGKDDTTIYNKDDLALTIDYITDNNVINVYYRDQYGITDEVIEHTEVSKDGTVTMVTGGTVQIVDNENNTYDEEKVFKNDDSVNSIVITPDDEYEIVRITIQNIDNDGHVIDEVDANLYDILDDDNNVITEGLVKADGTATLNKDNGYFTGVTSSKHVEVEFRRKSNVIVKYLSVQDFEDDGSPKVLAEEVIIPGYEGKAFETGRKPVVFYQPSDRGITDDGDDDTRKTITEYERVTIDDNNNAVGNMYSDDLTIIYWYERIPAGILVKHIEVTEDDLNNGLTLESGTVIDSELISGFVSLEETTNRNVYSIDDETGEEINEKYKQYIFVDGPEVDIENLYIIGKDDNSLTVIYAQSEEDNDYAIEVRYYYEKQLYISTEVKLHEEEITKENGEKVNEFVRGGQITGETEEPYEIINKMGANEKEINIEPEYGYRIKQLTINDEPVDLTTFNEGENHSITLPAGYFDKIDENKHIVVEFEKIPAKVITKYIDIDTGEEILPDDIQDGFVKDQYTTERADADTYIPAGEEPENKDGVMLEEDTIVIYYYKKQFKITTDVIEYEELYHPLLELPKDGAQIVKKVLVKGGSISGEDEMPYEIVNRGDTSVNKIILKPDENYRIIAITINGKEAKIENEFGYTMAQFEDVQEDIHIEVQYERIPAKLIVQYLDEYGNVIEEEEKVIGSVTELYATYPKEIEGYELYEIAESANGSLVEGDNIVRYYYKQIIGEVTERGGALRTGDGIEKYFSILIISVGSCIYAIIKKKRI